MKIRFNKMFTPLTGCTHGPKSFPWWKPFGFLFCHITVTPPSKGYRLWFYTKAGGRCLDVYFDRRK